MSATADELEGSIETDGGDMQPGDEAVESAKAEHVPAFALEGSVMNGEGTDAASGASERLAKLLSMNTPAPAAEMSLASDDSELALRFATDAHEDAAQIAAQRLEALLSSADRHCRDHVHVATVDDVEPTPPPDDVGTKSAAMYRGYTPSSRLATLLDEAPYSAPLAVERGAQKNPDSDSQSITNKPQSTESAPPELSSPVASSAASRLDSLLHQVSTPTISVQRSESASRLDALLAVEVGGNQNKAGKTRSTQQADIWYQILDNTERCEAAVTLDQMYELHKQGTVGPTTMVWKEDMPDWTTLAETCWLGELEQEKYTSEPGEVQLSLKPHVCAEGSEKAGARGRDLRVRNQSQRKGTSKSQRANGGLQTSTSMPPPSPDSSRAVASDPAEISGLRNAMRTNTRASMKTTAASGPVTASTSNKLELVAQESLRRSQSAADTLDTLLRKPRAENVARSISSSRSSIHVRQASEFKFVGNSSNAYDQTLRRYSKASEFRTTSSMENKDTKPSAIHSMNELMHHPANAELMHHPYLVRLLAQAQEGPVPEPQTEPELELEPGPEPELDRERLLQPTSSVAPSSSSSAPTDSTAHSPSVRVPLRSGVQVHSKSVAAPAPVPAAAPYYEVLSWQRQHSREEEECTQPPPSPRGDDRHPGARISAAGDADWFQHRQHTESKISHAPWGTDERVKQPLEPSRTASARVSRRERSSPSRRHHNRSMNSTTRDQGTRRSTVHGRLRTASAKDGARDPSR